MRVLVLLLLLTPLPALADGWKFINGRFPEGEVTVFKLTTAQKARLELIRRCHTDNTKTPYLFTLTPQQALVLKREVGFSPELFAVFESFRGDTGVDIEINVINRFSEDAFEIPHNLLTRDHEARE